MTARPVVRPAAPGEANALWPLVASFATSFVPDETAFRRAFDSVTRRKDMLLVVAEDADGVVGYLLAGLHLTLFGNAPVCWVEELMVEDAHRGNGHGRALLEHAEEWARTHGAAYVSLATRRATEFYVRLGYEASATFFRKVLPV